MTNSLPSIPKPEREFPCAETRSGFAKPKIAALWHFSRVARGRKYHNTAQINTMKGIIIMNTIAKLNQKALVEKQGCNHSHTKKRIAKNLHHKERQLYKQYIRKETRWQV